MNPQLFQLIMAIVPGAIQTIKDLFRRDHPGDPVPTDEQIIAAYQAVLTSSLAKDAAWLEAHPE